MSRSLVHRGVVRSGPNYAIGSTNPISNEPIMPLLSFTEIPRSAHVASFPGHLATADAEVAHASCPRTSSRIVTLSPRSSLSALRTKSLIGTM